MVCCWSGCSLFLAFGRANAEHAAKQTWSVNRHVADILEIVLARSQVGPARQPFLACGMSVTEHFEQSLAVAADHILAHLLQMGNGLVDPACERIPISQ